MDSRGVVPKRRSGFTPVFAKPHEPVPARRHEIINAINEKIDSINVQYSVSSERKEIAIENSEKKNELIVSALMTGKRATGQRVLLRKGAFPTVFQGYGYNWCKVGTAQTITTYYYLIGRRHYSGLTRSLTPTITTYYYLIGRQMDNGQTLPRTRTLQEIATKMGAQGT
ncbi:MAG: hypothetical protein WCX63_08080, partial [Methanoregula sp.]